MAFDPKTMHAFAGLSRLSVAYARMSMSAGEVILRRTMMMAQGAMSPTEAARMVMEKPTAFAVSAEKAMAAAVRGGDATDVAEAALRPIGARARANARRLRR